MSENIVSGNVVTTDVVSGAVTRGNGVSEGADVPENAQIGGGEPWKRASGDRIRTPEEQRNLDHVLGLFRDVLVPLDPSKVDRYIAPDYIQHSIMAAPGRENLKAFLALIRGQNQSSSQRLLRAFVDGDHVILHYHVKRHQQDRGFVVIDIFRLADGMIVEHWDAVQNVPKQSPNPIPMF